MPVYETKGHLTGTIEPENVAQAQAYLREPDMAKYVGANAGLEGVLEWIQWDLAGDGHHYTVTAVTNRELNDDELKRLADETSGQNSDGHGENFEQQEFAWVEDEQGEETCSNCDGVGEVEIEGDREEMCGECDGRGYIEHEDGGHMVSFDWQTNDSTYVRVR